jgi:hypothetical protein
MSLLMIPEQIRGKLEGWLERGEPITQAHGRKEILFLMEYVPGGSPSMPAPV